MPAWVIFLAAVVATAQLCLGVRIGIKIGRLQQQRRMLVFQRKNRPPSRAARRALKWQECTAGVDELNQRAQSLSSEAEDHEPPLTEAFRAAISQLAEAAAALQGQIRDAGTLFTSEKAAWEGANAPSPATTADLPRPDPKGQPSGLTPAELLELANQPADHAGQSIQQHRFPYATRQYMAPCTEHELPASRDFQPVMCNDLSVNGISFVATYAPAFQFVVISVGAIVEPIFVHCRVRYSRKVVANDVDAYLVGCEFIKRLPPDQFDWNKISNQQAMLAGA